MKALVFLLVVLLLASVAGATLPPDLAESVHRIETFVASREPAETDSARLKRFFDLYWETSLRESPGLAIVVGYPDLGDLGGRWPDRSPEAAALSRRIVRLELDALASIDRSRLSPEEQVDFDLLRRWFLSDDERFERFSTLLIGPMSGIDLDLTTYLPYLPTRTVADYETILARLRGFPGAVDSTIAKLAEGLATGITPPRVTLSGVAGRVGGLLVDDPRQSPVLEPFQAIPESIPAAERERLKREAVRVFTDQVEPAVRKLRDYLAGTYVPGARETIAVKDLPDGKAFYSYMLRVSTTTDYTPEQIHELGLSEVRRIRGEMDAVIASTGFTGSFDEFSRFLRTDPRFFYDKPEDLVAAYRDIAKRIDPELVKLFRHLPRLPYGVRALEGEGAKSAPSGYYSSGTFSTGMPGWFLVNTYDLKSRPKWQMEALILHEAVPGHHLQYSIAQELEDLPEWRKWDVYPAFGEGWALYAESLGTELGLYKDPYSNFGRLSNEIWRAIRLVVDTGIHDRGWTRQQAIDYYTANSARSALEIENEVNRVISRPGTVPVYKVGELKIRELRSYAEKQLGPAFDLRAFHDHLLGHGQLPLDLLDASVKAWVAEQVKSPPTPTAPPRSAAGIR
ncbi:MAG TPA: DUF885 domain-containing protein [Thermoanaerobaculia bacterium]|jgi:uncharacterized protein (DUF885 family)|nr:DUF885 domain-containing protein [Thermoanaerobaculia bacterium]